MSSVRLLPFQKQILSSLFPTDPSNDSLLILAPGLGLRTILLAFLVQQSDYDKQRDDRDWGKVIVVNANEDDVNGFSDEVVLNTLDLGGKDTAER